MREAVLKLDRRSRRSQDAHLPDGSIYKQLGDVRFKKKIPSKRANEASVAARKPF